MSVIPCRPAAAAAPAPARHGLELAVDQALVHVLRIVIQFGSVECREARTAQPRTYTYARIYINTSKTYHHYRQALPLLAYHHQRPALLLPLLLLIPS